ncbi:MAG: efflux transporter outer membrane subunit [Deltaproteobacteria bacterium]|jgi:multidrug efflux system outer membrane protein|nr:efflux transporter outer membrane subunit [Deltaproteobacteria bacterium]
MQKISIQILLCSCLLLAACTLAPDYERPALDLPTTEQVQPNEVVDISDFVNPEWWKMFDDPVLNVLITQTLDYNKDLKQALARVTEARALARVAFSALLPSLGVKGTYDKNHPSEHTLSVSPEKTFSDYLLLGGASYELDLWGKYRDLDTVAWAEYLATEAAYNSVRLMLIVNTVKTYFTLRTLDTKLEVAKKTWASRQKSYQIYEIQYRNGYVSELDFKRIAAEMYSVESQVYELENQLAQTQTALFVLVGKTPRQIASEVLERGKPIEEMAITTLVPDKLPSEVLTMRPDIFQAEQLLIAANARIGVARAAFFPSISLTAGLGNESLHLSNLFEGGSKVWNWSGGVSLPIFQGGSLVARLKYSKAYKEEMLAKYEKTVQAAFKDILDALTTNRLARKSLASRLEQTTALRRSVELANIQKTAGLIGILDVLDVERGLLQVEMDLATAYLNQLFAVVGVCEALGGGWKEL